MKVGRIGGWKKGGVLWQMWAAVTTSDINLCSKVCLHLLLNVHEVLKKRKMVFL